MKSFHQKLIQIIITEFLGADPASANVHIANLFRQKDTTAFGKDNKWEFYKVGKGDKGNKGLVEGSIFEEMQKKPLNKSTNLSK